MNLHWYMIIIQNPQFRVQFILGVVPRHSWCVHSFYGFEKVYNSMYLSFCNYTEYFHCPKMYALPIHSSATPIPDNHSYFYHVHSFIFFRLTHSWNHTVYRLFRLASFTEECGFMVLPWLNGLITHTFFSVDNVSLSVCTTLYLSIHWLKIILILLQGCGNYEYSL